MTVIFANRQDIDCETLPKIWEGQPNINLIEITPQSVDWEDKVDEALANEEDTLIFAGHGTEDGLLFPDFDKGMYILHENNVHLIKAKNVICVWCYAANFCETHNLHAFATSMFISNANEAYDYSIYGYSDEQIRDNSKRFDCELGDLLDSKVPLNEWCERLTASMDADNAVDMFNREGLTYIE
jgi:hypothetical protein